MHNLTVTHFNLTMYKVSKFDNLLQTLGRLWRGGLGFS
ncbi:unnamed protein product [Spirodela intermedia]|uniref:Uncharacterized protein n=2 Tax=Spirodela intermedia TaxID=51605 RepID=A0A7I8LLL1_SPIIN|nr:unnamed protein product [Spirodela intermedia]CAA6672926.1 unnamed protein product [Spirodela intermedia]CAA7410148.1 unnamed protein product [Spirodela intermedia]